MKINIKPDTPLSALFRDNHHNELRTVIESWRQYLIVDYPSTDALELSHFEFDKKRIRFKDVYANLFDLENIGALKVTLRCLAQYLSEHSNLNANYNSLYQQMKNYRMSWQ